jgi:hypothetical protein
MNTSPSHGPRRRRKLRLQSGVIVIGDADKKLEET